MKIKNKEKRKKVTVVIPAYNEESRIFKIIKEVEKFSDRIIVVDDGSSDKTYTMVKGKKVILLRHMINLGQGAALQTGIEYARKIDTEILITFDADGQFKAEEIPLLVEPIKLGQVDVILGSRFLGKMVDIPKLRFIILRLAIVFTHIFYGIKLTDAHNGFRAFGKKAIGNINIAHNRWAHPSDIIDQIIRNKLSYKESSVTIIYSKYSISKGQKNLHAFEVLFDLVIGKLL